MPSCDHTGTPRHFHSSTTPGSACRMSARTRASTGPRQSSRSLILASISRAGVWPPGPSFRLPLFMTVIASFVMPWPGLARGSAPLLHPQQVARGIPHGAIAHTVGLVGRLLDNLRAARLDALERGIEVRGGQQHDGVGALGHHLGDGALLLVGDARARRRREKHDGGTRLVARTDGDPAHAVVADIVADLETERVAIERK